jgi:hypothetical protein
MKSALKLSKLLNASAIAFAVTLASSSYSYAANTRNTYVGLDAVYNSMKLKKEYGGNIFSKKMAPGLNFSVGHMFHENFGAELGIEVEKKMKRTARVPAGEIIANMPALDPADGISWEDYNTQIKQRHPYVGFVVKSNLFNNTFASLMIGGALSDIKASFHKFDDSGVGPLPAQDQLTKTFKKTKLIPIIKVQLEQKFINNFSIKALITWKILLTLKFQQKKPLLLVA